MQFSPAQQEHAAAEVRPVLWARLAVNHTKKTFFASCAVPLALLVIVILTGFSIDNPASNDYIIRNDERTRLDDARSAARDEYPFLEEADGAAPERGDLESGDTFFVLFRGRLGPDGDVADLETAGDAEKILTKEGVALMKKAEDDIFNDQAYKRICFRDPDEVDCSGEIAECARPLSILDSKHLYGKQDANGNVCGRKSGSEEVSDEAFAAFLEELVQEGDGTKRVNPDFAGYMGIDFTPESKTTWITQSQFRVGSPFKGFASVDDRPDDQTKLYDDFAKDVFDRIEGYTTPRIDVFLTGPSVADINFDSIVTRDLSFSIAAIVLVFLVICIHTSSPFLAATSMFQIFLAFPFAYVVYTYIFQQKYFAALQVLVIFLILGIGADDVFVFIDAWKQAGVVLGSNCDLVTRMSWTYRRAVKAMSVTSVTTAAAFFVTATSKIMPIGTLGVWAALLILLQFVLVITIFPCATIIWHRFFRVRTVTNCFKKPEEGMENTPTPNFFTRFLPSKMRKEKEAEAEEYRAVERFFRGRWVNTINKLRYFLIALGVVLVGLSLWRAALLAPPEEAEEFLPASHPIRVSFDMLRDAFPTSEADNQLRVRVTWGVSDVDRTGTSRFETEDTGKVVLDDAFDMKSAAAQDHILEACTFFKDQKDLIFQEDTIKDSVECWIEDFKEWRSKSNKGENFETYATDEDFIDQLIDFGTTVTDGGQPYIKYLYGQHFAFNAERNRIVFTEIRFVSPLKAAVPYNKMWPVYNKWQDELAELNKNAPDGVNKAIATGGYPWMWQITQRTLVSAMFQGIGIMLAVALVALTVSTHNWYVAILATVAIGSIVAMLLGIVQLLGWVLGITESIGVVIAVGYSFDGAAHIATAYVESKNEDRFNRTRDALTDLGISILFGAISTLLAGFMLFPAIIIFFVKFAGFIVATVALGVIWSLIFFPALLITIGPTGSFGDLRPLWKKVTGRFRRKRDSQSVGTSTDAGTEKALKPSNDPSSEDDTTGL